MNVSLSWGLRGGANEGCIDNKAQMKKDLPIKLITFIRSSSKKASPFNYDKLQLAQSCLVKAM